MIKNTNNQRPAAPALAAQGEPQAFTLAKLQRLYSHSGPRADVFGRRPALPSEIQRLTTSRRKTEEKE